MIVTYRDSLGYVEVTVAEGGIYFNDGFAYFGSENHDYKILADQIACIYESQ